MPKKAEYHCKECGETVNLKGDRPWCSTCDARVLFKLRPKTVRRVEAR